VTPDVEVDNLPHETFTGRDRQLEVAIDLLQKKMKEQPMLPYKATAIPPIRR
jgi:tricorn protease